MSKIIFILFLFLVLFWATSYFFTEEGGEAEEDLVVAACPTFHYMLEKLEDERGITGIKTESTAKSLELLGADEADLIISGRTLRENEPELLSQKIGKGYDFLFIQEALIPEEEMKFVPFYTDLKKEDIIRDFAHIAEENLTEVQEIENYLHKGVVITALEGALVGEPVHILDASGNRLRLSRLPRIHYFEDFPEENLSIFKDLESR